MRPSPDCFCDGRVPWCPPCVVGVATTMRHDHPETLSVSMLKRRIPGITGHEAALLVEATKGMLTYSIPLKARRNGQRY
ncbi:MAG: hypothetical protein E3J29_00230, partial [Dehalococcoidia bacterium]